MKPNLRLLLVASAAFAALLLAIAAVWLSVEGGSAVPTGGGGSPRVRSADGACIYRSRIEYDDGRAVRAQYRARIDSTADGATARDGLCHIEGLGEVSFRDAISLSPTRFSAARTGAFRDGNWTQEEALDLGALGRARVQMSYRREGERLEFDTGTFSLDASPLGFDTAHARVLGHFIGDEESVCKSTLTLRRGAYTANVTSLESIGADDEDGSSGVLPGVGGWKTLCGSPRWNLQEEREFGWGTFLGGLFHLAVGAIKTSASAAVVAASAAAVPGTGGLATPLAIAGLVVGADGILEGATQMGGGLALIEKAFREGGRGTPFGQQFMAAIRSDPAYSLLTDLAERFGRRVGGDAGAEAAGFVAELAKIILAGKIEGADAILRRLAASVRSAIRGSEWIRGPAAAKIALVADRAIRGISKADDLVAAVELSARYAPDLRLVRSEDLVVTRRQEEAFQSRAFAKSSPSWVVRDLVDQWLSGNLSGAIYHLPADVRDAFRVIGEQWVAGGEARRYRSWGAAIRIDGERVHDAEADVDYVFTYTVPQSERDGVPIPKGPEATVEELAEGVRVSVRGTVTLERTDEGWKLVRSSNGWNAREIAQKQGKGRSKPADRPSFASTCAQCGQGVDSGTAITFKDPKNSDQWHFCCGEHMSKWYFDTAKDMKTDSGKRRFAGWSKIDERTYVGRSEW